MLIGNKMGATLPCQNTCRHTLHTISSPQNERDAFKSAVKATTKGEASTRASPQSRSPLSCSGISGSRTSFLKAGLKVWVPKGAIYKTVTTGVASRCCPSQLRFFRRIFRRGRGTNDQSRNVTERCLEWSNPLSIDFVKLCKVVDSLRRDTLWKSWSSHRSPAPMKMFYRQF